MKVSVIIPTYNEAKTILACINSLKEQPYHPLEIIVVDDGSTDKTVKLVKKTKGVKLLRQLHLGPAPARNKGSSRARGDILVFVDADMTFDKHFIKNLIKPILNKDANGTFTKDETVANWESTWARCWNWETTGSRTKLRLPKNYPDTSPVFRAITKKEFDRVGGFDAIGYTDDWTLSKKLGYKSQVAPQAIIYHKNPDSLGKVYSQAKWIGKRRYKLWEVGRFLALVRASLPVSLIIGSLKAIKYKTFKYIIFKIIYDFGISIGIISYWLRRKHAK